MALLYRSMGVALLCSTAAHTASAQSGSTVTSSGNSASINYNSRVLAQGLSHPWSLAFLPDGSMLITERPGRLRRLSQGKLSEPITGVPAVLAKSQGGLFDVVLHPDYDVNGWIYLSLAHGHASANATRLVRARLDGDQLVETETLFTATPLKDTTVHYGARFSFLPDHTLVLSVGDGFDFREQAQALDNHLGKFIRIRDDGSIPEDNPFTDNPDALSEIYSYGHRNQQAIVYDHKRQALWAHEHGPAGGDEVNKLIAGTNYGWPLATMGRDYSGAAISPYQELPGMASPQWDWTPSIAPGGMTIIAGEQFSHWQGDLLVAALKSRDVRRMRIEKGRMREVETLFSEFGARIRDIREAPDGSLYLLTDDSVNGKVIQIEPIP